MFELIPNWHPVAVHFSVALLLTATFVLTWSFVRGRKQSDVTGISAGRLLLWLGLIAIVTTVIAGLQAYYSVDHDGPSHAAMTNHRNWALAALAAFLIVGGLAWRNRKADLAGYIVALMLVSSGLLLVTAYKGGELVYRYGLGVISLPAATGDGHDHAHEGDSINEHEEAESGGDHKHVDVAANKHEHESVTQDDSHDHPAVVREDPTSVADALDAALRNGDSDAVAGILADDVLILEGGHAQKSRADYMNGHMKSDMAFLPNVTSTILEREVRQAGDLAWVITHSRTQGSYQDKEIDQLSREMLVMKHDGHNWRVTLIHWGDK